MNGVLTEVQKLATTASCDSNSFFGLRAHLHMLGGGQSQTSCVLLPVSIWPVLTCTGTPSVLSSLHSHVVHVPLD